MLQVTACCGKHLGSVQCVHACLSLGFTRPCVLGGAWDVASISLPLHLPRLGSTALCLSKHSATVFACILLPVLQAAYCPRRLVLQSHSHHYGGLHVPLPLLWDAYSHAAATGISNTVQHVGHCYCTASLCLLQHRCLSLSNLGITVSFRDLGGSLGGLFWRPETVVQGYAALREPTALDLLP